MGKNDKKGGGKPVTDDPRFSGVHSDPRFNLPGRKKGKVQLDERFKAAIRDNDDFKQKVTVDKYGRKVKQDKVQKELKKYANLSEDELEDKPKKSKKKEEEESDSEEESGSENEEDSSESEEESSGEETGSKVIDRARGEGLSDVSESSSSESDSDSSSSSDDSSSSDEESEEEDEIGTAGVVPSTDKAPTGDETTTFACVNMDWDNVRAVDLMATFSSFVPPKGKILSVKIYPSEYGKQQMQREEQEGPAREFFEKKKRNDSDSEDEVTAKNLIQEDKGEEVNSSTLRKYQLQRLQYYYAVVTCDSIATARNIYDNCDGTEYESTANFFDLRYVPEGMTFDDEPRDQCEKIPADYKPNTFVTDALQHSKVKLTWDETPAERLKLAEKAFNQKDLDDMDFKAYLASDSDEDEAENEEEAREKYRSLLGNVFERAKEEEDGNVEITFTPGLDEENNKDDDEEDRDETTIEKYKRKSKERKQARLERMKQKNQAEIEEQPEPATTGKKAKKKAEAEARAKKTAELELLMMDDNAVGPDAKTSEEGKKGKKKKGGKPQAEESEVNLSDPRFEAMFENPDFAIDTTAPQYKRTDAMDKLMQERRRRYDADTSEEKTRKKRKTDSKPDGQNVDVLINKLKRNAKK